MPQQYGAVFGSRRDVAVGGDVALRATHARHHAVVTEDYLYYFSGFCAEDSEAIVPESGCDEEPRVHGGDETVAARPYSLGEVVAQLTSSQGLSTARGPDGVHE